MWLFKRKPEKSQDKPREVKFGEMLNCTAAQKNSEKEAELAETKRKKEVLAEHGAKVLFNLLKDRFVEEAEKGEYWYAIPVLEMEAIMTKKRLK